MNKTIRPLIITAFLFLVSHYVLCQNYYQLGWEEMNGGDLHRTIEFFEQAIENNQSREKAILTLAMLYPRVNRIDDGAKLYLDYFKNAKNPYPETYALFFEETVVGEGMRKNDVQFELLMMIKNDDRYGNFFDAILGYRIGAHYSFSNNANEAKKYYEKIPSIRKWMLVGPFDNVMNSGYNKDFGVLESGSGNQQFKSKYGTEVSWFIPIGYQIDGYMFKENHFVNDNSIYYAQTFIECQQDEKAILKFGYSGSLKVWLNDALVYSQPEKRVTEMDYYQIECTLNKGFNRLLVQLGDYEYEYANFSMRFTDRQHDALILDEFSEIKPYSKSETDIIFLGFQPINELKSKQDSTDILYDILLCKAYRRSFELDLAEEAIMSAYEKAPDNYLVLLNLNILYGDIGNSTEQNRIYEKLKTLYPTDIDILRNNISDQINNDNKIEAKELVNIYLDKYYTSSSYYYYMIKLAGMNEEYDDVISFIDSNYLINPNNYDAYIDKYQLDQSMGKILLITIK